MNVRIAAAITGTNSAPTLATQGVAISGPEATTDNHVMGAQEIIAWYDGNASDATVTIYGWMPLQDKWLIMGTALGKTSAGARVPLDLSIGVSRLYAHVSAMGTVTSMDIWGSTQVNSNMM